MVSFPGLNAEGQQAAAQQYFALRQADSGDCVVAVGVKAIAPGDQIFGTFVSYGEARNALDENCDVTPPDSLPGRFRILHFPYLQSHS